MINHNLLDDPNALNSVASVNNILSDYEGEIRSSDVIYGSTNQVENVKVHTITFYFGDKVIGEVKFKKSGTKAEKIERGKKILMKELQKNNMLGLAGQMLYSPFCNFKIR